MAEIKKITAIVVFLVLLMGLSVPVIYAQSTCPLTITDSLGRVGDLSTLNGLVKAAGLDRVLSGPGQYTLFAPTNAALASVPSDSLNALRGDRAALGDLLKYHVVPGKISYTDLTRMKELKTIDGKTLPVETRDGVVTVGGARVLSSGVDSNNGVIYPVNNVLTPPGFAFPQPQVSRATGGIPWWPLLGLLLGALALGSLLLYLLTRRERRYVEPAEAPPRRIEEPVRYEETRRVEEPVRREEPYRAEEHVGREEPLRREEPHRVEEHVRHEEPRRGEEPVRREEHVVREEPRRAEEHVTRRVEEPVRREEPHRVREHVRHEEPRRAEEHVKREEPRAHVEEKHVRAPEIAIPDVEHIVKNVDLPLSGDSLKGLDELIRIGKFKDKQDFLGFLAKSYMANNVGSTIGKTNDLPASTVTDIITKTGIGRGFMEGDVKKYLAPLLTAGFMAIYGHMTGKPAVPDILDIVKNVDLPLSGDALQGLNELISMGTFKDKPDFLSFLAKSYINNNLGSTISKTNDVPSSTILDIITKSGIGRGFMEGDVKKYLVPLLFTGFMAVYKYLARRPAVKPA